MNIYLNDTPVSLPTMSMSIQDLLDWKGVKSGGTAVAVNDSIIRHSDWTSVLLKQDDRVVIISAAFGG